MKQIMILLLFIICFPKVTVAQDTYFSQFYSASSYLNPALTGIEEESKLTFNYRNQWPELESAFITYNTAFETQLTAINSGLSINLFRDLAGDGMLTTTALNTNYAYEVGLNKEIRLRMGVRVGIVQKNINWSDLIFEDMIDSRKGVIYNTQQTFGEPVSFIDLSGGIFIYNENYYGGFAVDHLNEAADGFINQEGQSRLQRKINIHGGAKFKNPNNSNRYISPNFLISNQGAFTKINVGIYFETSPLVFGVWYASDQSIVWMAGIHAKRFRVAYSYDLYTSKMIGKSIASHEISYTQTFKKTGKKKKRYRTTLCPVF
ncbi:MAG: PorP/SprF family type IX secretion system membrane protein [Flavobacteriales bacterium]|nr:PorP/SprF family type IX secretion system membrane protein [Flavobacteriales bacterium]